MGSRPTVYEVERKDEKVSVSKLEKIDRVNGHTGNIVNPESDFENEISL